MKFIFSPLIAIIFGMMMFAPLGVMAQTQPQFYVTALPTSVTTTAFNASFRVDNPPTKPVTFYAWIGEQGQPFKDWQKRNILLAQVLPTSNMPFLFDISFNFSSLGLVAGKKYEYAIANQTAVNGAVFFNTPGDSITECFTTTAGQVPCTTSSGTSEGAGGTTGGTQTTGGTSGAGGGTTNTSGTGGVSGAGGTTNTQEEDRNRASGAGGDPSLVNTSSQALQITGVITSIVPSGTNAGTVTGSITTNQETGLGVYLKYGKLNDANATGLFTTSHVATNTAAAGSTTPFTKELTSLDSNTTYYVWMWDDFIRTPISSVFSFSTDASGKAIPKNVPVEENTAGVTNLNEDPNKETEKEKEEAEKEQEVNDGLRDTFLKNPFKTLDSFPKIVAAVINNIVLPIAVPFIAVMIIYSGFLFVVARKQGSLATLEQAKDTLKYTLIGAALMLGAFVIANAIQGTLNSILN